MEPEADANNCGGLHSRDACPRLAPMVECAKREHVTVVELGASYASLDGPDLETAGSLLLSLAATAEPPLLVLDMARTELIGSTFLELLVRAWKRLRERGGHMALCGLTPFCAELLAVTHLTALWDTFPTQEEAVAAISTYAEGRR